MGKAHGTGIGGFILFFASYAILGSVLGVLFVYLVAMRLFWSPPTDGSLLDKILNLCAAVSTGFFGVLLGAYVLSAVMKTYPARAIGGAFVLWLIANYGLHFAFFPERTDFEIYAGLVQAAVASVTTWNRLPTSPFVLTGDAAPSLPNFFALSRARRSARLASKRFRRLYSPSLRSPVRRSHWACLRSEFPVLIGSFSIAWSSSCCFLCLPAI